MKKAGNGTVPPEDSIDRYDWSKARRGHHAGRIHLGTQMLRLDDDLGDLFPNSEAVNAALRAIVALGQVLPKPVARARARKKSAA